MPPAPSARRPEVADGAWAERGHWPCLAECSHVQTRARPARHANAARVQAGQKNSCSAKPLLRSGSSSRRCLRGDRRVLRRCRHRVYPARRQRATRWTRPPWSVQRLASAWWTFGGRLASVWQRAKDRTSAPGRGNTALEGRLAEITAGCRSIGSHLGRDSFEFSARVSRPWTPAWDIGSISRRPTHSCCRLLCSGQWRS